MRQWRRAMKMVALVAAMACSSGCILAAAAVGAGAVAGGVLYVKGELQADVAATPPRVTDAAKRALTDLSLLNVSATGTGIDGLVTARTAADKRVEITVRRKTDSLTAVGIRVGIFGDEDLSRTILQRIEGNLRSR